MGKRERRVPVDGERLDAVKQFINEARRNLGASEMLRTDSSTVEFLIWFFEQERIEPARRRLAEIDRAEKRWELASQLRDHANRVFADPKSSDTAIESAHKALREARALEQQGI